MFSIYYHKQNLVFFFFFDEKLVICGVCFEQMAVMDGCEATRLIRMEEKSHGIHIPIFALTAHPIFEEATRRKICDAGMDFHLTKPLQKNQLLDAIKSIAS